LADGRSLTIERPCAPGFASNPLSWDDVTAKFRHCAHGVIDEKAQDAIIAQVADIENLSSVRPLLKLLTPDVQTRQIRSA
jgi:hypothetical protein